MLGGFGGIRGGNKHGKVRKNAVCGSVGDVPTLAGRWIELYPLRIHGDGDEGILRGEFEKSSPGNRWRGVDRGEMLGCAERLEIVEDPVA